MAITSTFQALYKKYFPESRIFGRAINDHPCLGLIKRRKDFVGTSAGISYRYANTSSRSATFADSQTNANLSRNVEYLLTRRTTYHTVRLSPEEIYASEGQKGAYETAVKDTMNSVADSLGEDWSNQFLGDKGEYGVLCRLSNFNTTTGVATLAVGKESAITNIDVGMVLEASDDPSTSGSTIRAGTGTVTAVNEAAGTFTITPVNPAGWANGANTDYVFLQGDTATAGTPLKMSGFFSWNPVTLPSPDSFYGVNRALHRERLAGKIQDATGLRIDEAIKLGVMTVNRGKGKITDLILNHEKFLELLNVSEQKERATFETTLRQGRFMTKIGYEGIKVYTSSGAINVWADAACPVDKAAGFNREDWTFFTLGEPGRMIEHDGHAMQWVADSPDFEFRFITLGNFYCKNPNNNLTIYNLDLTA